MWLNANDLRWFGRYRFCTHADRLLDLDLLGSLLQGPFPIAKVLQLESQQLGTHLGAPQHTSPGVSSSVQSNQLRRIARRCAMQDKGFALKNHQGGSHSNHISIFPCLTPSAKGFKICGAKTRGPKGFKICAESDSAGNRLVCRIEHGNGEHALHEHGPLSQVLNDSQGPSVDPWKTQLTLRLLKLPSPCLVAQEQVLNTLSCGEGRH